MRRENELIGVFGKKGGGKTSIAASLTADSNRLIVFDHNREYERGMIVTNPQQLIDAIRKYNSSAFRLIYRFDDSMRLSEHAEFFLRAAYTVTNYTLLFEEIDRVSEPRSMPEGLDNIVNVGRHKGISLIALSRRPARVPRDLTSNADRIFVAGPINEPKDVDYLSEFMGSEVSEKVRALKREERKFAEFIEWTQDEIAIGTIDYETKEIIKQATPNKTVTK